MSQRIVKYIVQIYIIKAIKQFVNKLSSQLMSQQTELLRQYFCNSYILIFQKEFIRILSYIQPLLIYCKAQTIQSISHSIFLKTMKRNPDFTEMLDHQKEIQALQDQLQDQVMEISSKDARIFELEERINDLENRERINMINTQETVHHYIQERLGESTRENQKLREQLRQRQRYEAGLQMSSQEKDSQICCLREMLTSKEQEMGSLLESVSNEIALQQKSIEGMKVEIDNLIAECQLKESHLRKNQAEMADLKKQEEQKMVILQQKNVMLYQKIAQYQKTLIIRQQMADQIQIANQQLRTDLNLSEKNRDHLTNLVNYCKSRVLELQDEMGQTDQQKKQMEGIIKKFQTKLNENENNIREYRFKVRSLQEDGKIMREQIGEMKEKTQKQEEEINDLYSLKLKNYMRIKDAQKDIAKLTLTLNEKDHQIAQLKSACSDFERQKLQIQKHLSEKNIQIHDLQQLMAEKNQVIEDQSQKLQEFTRNMDYIDKKMQQDSLIKIFMGKEYEEKFHSLECIIKEKQQKVYELSGKIIQREVEASRKIEKLKRQLQEKPLLKNSLKEISVAKQKLEAEIMRLKKEGCGKDQTASTYQRQILNMKQTLMESQQTLILLEKELKSKEDELLKLKSTNGDLNAQIDNLISVVEKMNAELTNSKLQALKFSQNEAMLKDQQDQLNWRIIELTSQKEVLLAKLQDQSKEADTMQQKINQLHQITERQTQCFSNILTKLQLCDDSDQFEILDHDDFVVIDSKESKVKELIRKIDQFRCSVATLSGK